MPPGDLVLAELPAKEHGLAAVERRKVDETAVRILHLGAVAPDLVHQARQATLDAVDLRGRLGELGGRNTAAVAADLLLEAFLALECGGVLRPGLDELLDERAHLFELGVRLLRREVTHARTLC